MFASSHFFSLDCLFNPLPSERRAKLTLVSPLTLAPLFICPCPLLFRILYAVLNWMLICDISSHVCMCVLAVRFLGSLGKGLGVVD